MCTLPFVDEHVSGVHYSHTQHGFQFEQRPSLVLYRVDIQDGYTRELRAIVGVVEDVSIVYI